MKAKRMIGRQSSLKNHHTGSEEYGHTDDKDWMWKSSSDGTHPKPRNCFVTNTSGEDTRSSAISRESAHLTWLYCTVQKTF